MQAIRLMQKDELAETLLLIRNVFTEFEAPGYSEQGVETFFEFTEQPGIEQGIASGEFKFWVCTDNGSVVGTIAMMNATHVCMLFVDKSCHRKGIASKLLSAALQGIEDETDITVNSSPYAVPFYHAVGFADTDELTEKDGIKYVPMAAKYKELINA